MNERTQSDDINTFEKFLCVVMIALLILLGVCIFTFPQYFIWVFGGFILFCLALNAFDKSRISEIKSSSDGGVISCSSSSTSDSCGGGDGC